MLKSEYIDYINEDDEFYADFNMTDFVDYIKTMRMTVKGKVKEIYIAS